MKNSRSCIGSRQAVAEGLRDQHVLVTGAASGIGRATAEHLAELGALVACTDREVEGVEELAKRLRDRDLRAEAWHLDVQHASSVEAGVEDVERRLGPLHAVVNCAGVTGQTGRRSHEIDVEDLDHVYRVNLRGAFLVSRSVLPRMQERRYGRILHVASIAGKEGNAGMVA
jgi:2-dehydro-3-deoxy-L-rhamnonate dehydrogenase (NAD+)